jgi:hypothetical protein
MGVSPRRFVLPPHAIPYEQVLRHHRSKRRGGKRGQVLSPPLSYQCFLFHTLIRGILQSPNSMISLIREYFRANLSIILSSTPFF